MKFTNEEKAVKELHCYMYCLYESLENFKNKNYGHAAVYLENAARSLRELERMKTVENQPNHIVTFFATIRNHDGHN